MILRNKAIIIVLLGILILLPACFSYSFRGSLPSDLKTIAIPLFEDRSRWAGLQEKLYQGVIDGFISDNTLTIIEDESAADLVMTGVIQRIQTRRTGLSNDATVEEEQIVVTVKIECINQITNKPHWSANVSDFGAVSGNAGLAEREGAVDEAVEKLIEEIINRTLTVW